MGGIVEGPGGNEMGAGGGEGTKGVAGKWRRKKGRGCWRDRANVLQTAP